MTDDHTTADPTSEALLAAFRRALRLHRQFMARSLAEADLHPGQAMCLGALARNEGVTQRALAETMHIAPPTLSRMLTSLEKSGLVERRDDEADQRVTRVHLTPAGRRVAGRMRHALADLLPSVVATLSLEERTELARLLDKLTSSIAAAIEARAGEPGTGERAVAAGGGGEAGP